MTKINALKLRQSLGAVLDKIRSDGHPVLVEKGRQPAAVIISLEDYKRRFVDRDADQKRREIVESIKAANLSYASKGKSKQKKGTALLQSLRSSSK